MGLSIEGLRLPTANENDNMHCRVAALLYKDTLDAQDQSSHFGTTPQFGLKHYMDLGEGLFGRFSETFDIPDDVNKEAIQASYENGILRVVLPKNSVSMPTWSARPHYNNLRMYPGDGPSRHGNSYFRSGLLGRYPEDFQRGGN